MTTASPSKARPLSPHLGIYKFQISSVMSIFHRLTGLWLALGLPLLSIWLAVVVAGEKTYGSLAPILNQILGEIGLTFLSIFVVVFLGLAAFSFVKRVPQYIKAIWCLIVFGAGITLSVLYFPSELDRVCAYVGTAMLIGWTWAFFYHFFCGIRHLLWDVGKFLTLKGLHLTGWAAFSLSLISTAGIWARIWGVWQ